MSYLCILALYTVQLGASTAPKDVNEEEGAYITWAPLHRATRLMLQSAQLALIAISSFIRRYSREPSSSSNQSCTPRRPLLATSSSWTAGV
mmetsp:Transcript_67317/g.161403  ORF Transcript_67317/g.161403 Transcript_67317/m.161403 type:complete len:91 (+) Transcript_67317:100-372(+)